MLLRNARALGGAALMAWVTVASGSDQNAQVMAAIKSTLHDRFPEVKILDIQPAAAPHWYEIYTGDSIAYADEKGEYLLMGSLLETSSKRNLTSESLDAHNPIDFNALPFEQAIKTVRGNGSRKLAVFSDPDCPYCRKLEKDLASLTDVTIYTFLYPIAELHPDAAKKAHAIWCAPDRSKAWAQWMSDEPKLPPEGTCKNDPTSDLQALAGRIHVSATPTLFTSSGKRASGVPSVSLEEFLKK